MITLVKEGTHLAIGRLLRKSDEAWIAIAFWGEGALEKLSLAPRLKAIRGIVCNLESGACNPKIIGELRSLGYSIRSHENLHAKLICTDQAVFVGSSNASANGLGFEGSELGGNLEANALVVDDGKFKTACRDYLRQIWKEAHNITDTQLAAAEIAWKNRRASRHKMRVAARYPKSLLRQMKSNRAFFEDLPISLWVYDDYGLSDTATRELRRAQDEIGNKKIAAYEDLDEEPSEGEVVVDFHRSRGKLTWGAFGNLSISHASGGVEDT